MEDQTAVHIFEQAGLGKAPFRFVGHWTMPPRGLQEANPEAYNREMADHPHVTSGGGVGSCHYCGTPISVHCMVRSGDGQTFFVGSDCVNKTGDAGLQAGLRRMARERNREKNEAKRKALIPTLTVLVADNADLLASQPHPKSYFAAKGKTFKDYADWMVDRRTYSLNGTREAIAIIKAVLIP